MQRASRGHLGKAREGLGLGSEPGPMVSPSCRVRLALLDLKGTEVTRVPQGLR